MTTPNASHASPAAAPARANANRPPLTDDEILGIVTNADVRSASRPAANTATRANSNSASPANRNGAPAANSTDAAARANAGAASRGVANLPNRGSVDRLGSGEPDDPFADDNAANGDANRNNAESANSRADSSDAVGDNNADTNVETGADTNADMGAEPAEFRAIFETNPPLRDAWRDAQTFHELFPNAEDAREIQKMFPTADSARAAGQQLNDLAKLDTLFFSNRPESHAELAAAVYRLNPAAFRNLARVMNAISASGGASDTARAATNAAAAPGRRLGDRADTGATRRSPASTAPAAAQTAAGDFDSASGPTSGPISGPSSGIDAPQASSEAAPQFAPDANAHPNAAIAPEHAAFFHDTNAATVQGVFDAIHSHVDRLLPEGTSPAARQRLVAEIYREVDSSLRANPAFGQQLRQAFRGAGATPENQRAIVGMVVGRARQALPGIAKKVINEWTSAIVTRSNARSDRQRAAERRVDIASGAPGNDGHRALMPRDIDYRRMSDGDILNM